ncbi:DUF6325 family protein [Microbacterium sp. KSW4-4]|uniref:DUF6325 family protein n=1 Tax=Microbacterium sp. KSW4-4 TaxID=2851651 RepID=UPI001FFCAAE2|nr:DUF6325 family protein [Microbacterium sp. KSW4-4]MCK2031480.1 DUF1269 domain-containing protein [Microbacterium sp. KSW4-4]
MTDFPYGPVEIYLIGFDGDRPGREVAAAIIDLVGAGTVRVLDLLLVSRQWGGTMTVRELEEVIDDHGLASLEFLELGLTGEEDIRQLGAAIEPGTSAAILVVEHVWARRFAQALFDAGGRVLQTQEIPAAVVNELVAVT